MDAFSGTPEYRSTSKQPLKETLLLAVTFFFIFTPFQALQNLQSSLNQHESLGILSLACVYGASFLISFVTPAIMYNAGIKPCMVASWIGHTLYVMCNFYPAWMTLVPGSIVVGLITSPMWGSLETYLSTLACVDVELHEKQKKKGMNTLHAAFSRINGIFHSIFVGSQVAGNLISSAVLFFSTHKPIAAKDDGVICGSGYCPSAGEGHRIPRPEPHIIYVLLGVFLVCDVIGLTVGILGIPRLHQPQYTGREVCRKLKSYWHGFTQPKLLLLVPLFAAHGYIFTLHIGMFTEAFISCTLGLHMVGYVMAVWGLTTMLSSVLLGFAARYTGRPLLCTFAAVVDMTIMLTLLLWKPHGSRLPAFFALAALMGLVDGVWMVQMNAMIAVMFPAIVDSVFPAKSTWHSLTVAASFVVSKFVCPGTRIVIGMGILGTGYLSYLAAEIIHRRSLRMFRREDHEYALLNITEDMELSSKEQENRGPDMEGAEQEETEFNTDSLTERVLFKTTT
ncbi:protein unc-93 homolog A-like [Pomacea canaliculata]|nr:protein unc-93 homolog A-like [Pomacea canaliculata]XP_025092542.1 protein unc-93 homolog A-like [Pomacea canaliculata]XP_025092543.1 protein unc-93 homolog A-like [Pomacea canaliculata]XP_025092544.1 protein unc-93 homolog A-like [Pomacea canaliculata]